MTRPYWSEKSHRGRILAFVGIFGGVFSGILERIENI